MNNPRNQVTPVNGPSLETFPEPCHNPQCNRVIYPGSEDDTQGYCLACYRQQTKTRDVGLTAGSSDSDPIQQILNRYGPFEPLSSQAPALDQLFQSLNEEQAQELAKETIRLFTRDPCLAGELAANLVCLTDHPMSDLLEVFFNRSYFYPSVLYCFSDKHIFRETRERALWDSRLRKSVLAALAWIPLDQVAVFFHELQVNPPEWLSTVSPDFRSWTWLAGWEWGGEIPRRPLFSKSCFPLVANPDNPLHAGIDHGTTCGYCQRPLVQLYQLDATAAGIHGFQVPHCALTCETCGFHTAIYTEPGERGTWLWSAHNRHRPPTQGSSPRPFSRKNLRLGTGPPAPFRRACMPTIPVPRSQVGGLPTWFYKPAYPPCPECDETMTFLSQLASGSWDLGEEGLLQTFHCSDCQIAVTIFQKI